ncbi:MAG: transcriptional repressor AgaR [Pseudomonadota bacterium]
MNHGGQRRERILHLLIERGGAQVGELTALLGVSAVTVRSDLAALERLGKLTRTHGGALLLRGRPPEQHFRHKDQLNTDGKERIGARAALLVAGGDKIIIDSGTTTAMLARHLRAVPNLTVMTNGLNVANALAMANSVTVLLTGGQLRAQSLSMQGAQAQACLEQYSFDKLFLGVDGCDPQFGLTTHDEAEANLNRSMAARARQVIVLADASKFGQVTLHHICPLERVHAIITDGRPAERHCARLQQLGIELIIAE